MPAARFLDQQQTGHRIPGRELHLAAELIAAGESKTVEFKRTARYNEHTEGVDKRLEHEVVKSVAGFLNAAGGTLLIGVHDEQHITGIDVDYPLMGKKQDSDGFENWLVGKLIGELGQPAVGSFVEISFEAFDEGDVCRVDVKPSNQPVYAGEDAQLFVRMGNSTRSYNTRDAIEYIRTRW